MYEYKNEATNFDAEKMLTFMLKIIVIGMSSK